MLFRSNVVDLQETKINALEEQNAVFLKQINELEKQLAQGSTSPTQEDSATPTPEIEDEEEEAPQDDSDEEMAEEEEDEEDPEELPICTPEGELLMIVEDKDDTLRGTLALISAKSLELASVRSCSRIS